MGLQDRDYYKEKFDKTEKERPKSTILVVFIVIILILSLLLGLIIF